MTGQQLAGFGGRVGAQRQQRHAQALILVCRKAGGRLVQEGPRTRGLSERLQDDRLQADQAGSQAWIQLATGKR